MNMNMNFFFISPPSEMKFPMSPQSDRVRVRLCVRVHACMRAQRRVHALFRLTWKWNENENEFPSQSEMKLFISPRSERVLVAACAHLPINQQCSQHSQSSSDFGKRAGGHGAQCNVCGNSHQQIGEVAASLCLRPTCVQMRISDAWGWTNFTTDNLVPDVAS